MRFTARLIAALLWAWIAGAPAMAQQQSFATLTVTVHDAAGQALADTAISVYAVGKPVRSGVADAQGTCRFTGLSYGDYTLQAAMAAYSTTTLQPIRLKTAVAIVDLRLAPATGGQTPNGGSAPDASLPAFSLSGIEGTTAPSGYSSGASSEEASRVEDQAIGLDAADAATSAQTKHGGDRPAESAQQSALQAGVSADTLSLATNSALGICCLQQGRPGESLRSLEVLERLRPLDADLTQRLAAAYLALGANHSALSLLQNARSRGALNAATTRLLAQSYAGVGQRLFATEAYEAAAEMDPSLDNRFACGVGLLGVSAFDQAASLAKATLEQAPSSAKLRVLLAMAQDLGGHVQLALQSAIRTTALDPKYVPAYTLMAELIGGDLTPDENREIIERIGRFSDTHPDCAEAKYDYATALWKQQRVSGANIETRHIKTLLLLAIQQDPELYGAHLLLGVIAAEGGDYSTATRELEQAVRLRPADMEAHYRLSLAYRHIGSASQANQELTVFQTLRDKNKNLDEVQSWRSPRCSPPC
jgi:tetratricopeptide (TPR) repeat protein